VKLYEIIIRPLSAFGTTLKGDTIFGHFCWQAAYKPSLIEGGLENALAQYSERPFAVFSSAWPRIEREKTAYVLKRPDLPLSWLFPMHMEDREERYKRVKLHKKQKWMLIESSLELDLGKARFMNDRALADEMISMTAKENQSLLAGGDQMDFCTFFLQPHNTINRLTGTTGKGDFAPYTMEGYYYLPEAELALFVLVDEAMTSIDCIKEGLDMIGRFGFGRDASIGMGRFEVVDTNELPMPESAGANAFYTLAPCVPEQYDRGYFTPFIRYGKHGDRLANGGNPFKEPVIMADEGAVFFPANPGAFGKPYFGRAVTNVSKTQPEAVVQGYAPYIPIKVEH